MGPCSSTQTRPFLRGMYDRIAGLERARLAVLGKDNIAFEHVAGEERTSS